MSLRVVGLGEVLWDVLPAGRRLGGAPANFACHARALGVVADIVSAVGEDDLGRELLGELAGRGFSVATLGRDNNHPTGTVTVEMREGGQPDYTIHEPVAWDYLQPTSAARLAVEQADAICFGTLAQRREVSRRAMADLLQRAPVDALKVFDVNLRQDYYDLAVVETSLAVCNVLKLNEDELPVMCRLLAIEAADAEGRIRALVERYSLRAVALTRGAHGSLLVAGGACSQRAGEAVAVRDTVGAGDSFLAAFVVGLLRGLPLGKINACANALARHVCQSEGATPPIPNSIRQSLQDEN